MPSSPVATVGQSRPPPRLLGPVGGKLGADRGPGPGVARSVIDQLGSSLDSAAIVFSLTPAARPSLHSAFEALRGRAANLVEFDVYRTVPWLRTRRLPRSSLRFPFAVQGWRLARGLFDGLVVGVIGPTTGLAVARVSACPTWLPRHLPTSPGPWRSRPIWSVSA